MRYLFIIIILNAFSMHPAPAQTTNRNITCSDMRSSFSLNGNKFFYCTDDLWVIAEVGQTHNYKACIALGLNKHINFLYLSNKKISSIKVFGYSFSGLENPKWLLSKGDLARITIKLDKTLIISDEMHKVEISDVPPLRYSIAIGTNLKLDLKTTPSLEIVNKNNHKMLKTINEFKIRNYAHVTIGKQSWTLPLTGTFSAIEKLKECADSK